jgi:hypothetical protein
MGLFNFISILLSETQFEAVAFYQATVRHGPTTHLSPDGSPTKSRSRLATLRLFF